MPPVDPAEPLNPPDYAGGSLANLMGELERRMTGSSPAPGLRPDLAERVPEADTYVLLLMDGLGASQLDHPAASSLRDHAVGTIDAPFPTTTTVSLATVSSGVAPARHGWLGHVVWLPSIGDTVNSLKWIGRGGSIVEFDTSTYLPSPNLWERLAASGTEAITVQPGHFAESPLTKALYRGARFEPIWTTEELVDAVVTLAATPRRLLFAYLPQVDFAAHLHGQSSGAYEEALRLVDSAFSAIVHRLPAGAVMIGTADHGHIDYRAADKLLLDRRQVKGLAVFGDPRALYLRGSQTAIDRLASEVPARLLTRSELAPLWGAPSISELDPFADRLPDAALLADPGHLLIPGHMDRRLIGYHGGLDPRELKIPLLTAEHR